MAFLTRQQKREYWRDWARGARYKRWLAVNAGQTTCQWRQGKYLCGGALKIGQGGALSCLLCALKHAGLCRDCLQPVEKGPNAIRCHDCNLAERGAAVRRYTTRHRAAVNERGRTRMARWKAEGDPRYDKHMENKRLWRATNPDKVRAYKEAERARPHNKKRMKEYGQARRERIGKDWLCTVERLRTKGELPPRHCLGGCGTVLRGKMKKCRNCKIGKFMVAAEIVGATRAHLSAPLYGPWPTYAEFRKISTTPQNFGPRDSIARLATVE